LATDVGAKTGIDVRRSAQTTAAERPFLKMRARLENAGALDNMLINGAG
jgi:hypothetical protein